MHPDDLAKYPLGMPFFDGEIGEHGEVVWSEGIIGIVYEQ
jgi:hypothetical protein